MTLSNFSFNNGPFAVIHFRRLVARTLALTAFVALLTLSCCKKDDDGLQTDRARQLLTSGMWTVQSVTVDGLDKTSEHVALTLHFTNTNFTTTNGGPVWPASGFWTFADNTGKVIVRGDGVDIMVEELSKAKLVVAFTRETTTLGSGRVSSTSGEHVFTFVK